MRILHFSCLGLALLALSGCGGATEVRKQFGLKKDAPDEFVVLRRAPLEVPPPESLDLPSPRPGAQRPQETLPEVAARQALFGVDPAREASDAPMDKAVTPAEGRFLDLAGTQSADPSIRAVIDSETAALHNRNKPVAERLLNIGGDASQPSASVVDAKAEAARIQAARAEDSPITGDGTPYIEE